MAKSKNNIKNEKEVPENAILAFVKYSLKPKNIKDTRWIAGSGEVQGNGL